MAELGKLIGVYLYEDKYTAPDTSTVNRAGPKVGGGRIVVIMTAVVTDYTTASVSLMVGKRDEGGDDHYIKKENGSEVYSCSLEGEMILNEGESPLGTVVLPTTGDVLYFTFHGLVYEKPVG